MDAVTTDALPIPHSRLWNHGYQNQLRTNKRTEKQLNDERSAFLIPGTKLPEDGTAIPVVLVHNVLKAATPKHPTISCWSLILPTGWGNDFWKSFVFAGCRVGGQREFNQVLFENGKLSYPADYVECAAGRTWMAERRAELESKYNRRPPAKRAPRIEMDIGYSMTQACVNAGVYVDGVACPIRCVDPTTVKEASLKELEGAVVHVLVDYLERGTPSTGSEICFLSPPVAAEVERMLSSMDPMEPRKQLVEFVLQPQDVTVAGYVTTGNFNLSLGKGAGIGYVAARHLHTSPPTLVAVRDLRNDLYRYAHMHIVTD
jgi:ribonuclease P/MRP protein subunit POP1